MIKLFVPKVYVKSFKLLSLAKLKEKGIKVLICDIDNTLAPHDMAKPSEEAIKFLEEAKALGFKVAVASNNTKERVATFCEGLDVFYSYSSLKPLPFVYFKVARHFGVSTSQMAMLGDQLLTDMLGANLARVFTVLSSPLVLRDIPITKMNRKVENIVYSQLEKKNLLKKGDYFE